MGVLPGLKKYHLLGRACNRQLYPRGRQQNPQQACLPGSLETAPTSVGSSMCYQNTSIVCAGKRKAQAQLQRCQLRGHTQVGLNVLGCRHGAGMKPPAMTSMGSSPGARYPAGTSPGAVRRIQGFAPSTRQQSKWYLQVQLVHRRGQLSSMLDSQQACAHVWTRREPRPQHNLVSHSLAGCHV